MQSGCAYINFGADGSLLFTDKEGLGLNASFFKGRPCKNGQYLIDPGFNLFAGFERDLSKLLSLSVIPIGDILGTLVATGTLVVAGKWLALKERFVRWRLYVEFYKSRDVDFRFGALKHASRLWPWFGAPGDSRLDTGGYYASANAVRSN